MHSYLPSEQQKLQFISGKILDVFYDEFIKFIPPYILKREEEKRKRQEALTTKQDGKVGGVVPKKKQSTGTFAKSVGPNVALNKKASELQAKPK